MDDLYRDFILEHYKRPRNFGELTRHDREAHEVNPLCGDELGVQIEVKDGRIADLRFQGHGCAISQAAASMASEELIGMEIDEAAALDADWMLSLIHISFCRDIWRFSESCVSCIRRRRIRSLTRPGGLMLSDRRYSHADCIQRMGGHRPSARRR